jgi:hypothetical protein
MTIPQHGVTADRKTPDKLSALIENYSTMSRQDLCALLGESPRWIKRQIAILKYKGLITPKRTRQKETYREEDWPPKVKSLALELRNDKKLRLSEISAELDRVYGFKISAFSLGFWLKRFGSHNLTVQEWLNGHVEVETLRSKIESGTRVVDLAFEIESSNGVHVSDDDLLVFLKANGVDSFKAYRSRSINNRVDEISPEWMSESVRVKKSLREMASEADIPVARLRVKMRSENVIPIAKRVAWSQALEELRSNLLSSAPMSRTPSESDLHQMVLGWLAGDGHLTEEGRFTVNHSLAQMSYLYVKYQCLRRYVRNVITVQEKHSFVKGDTIKSSEHIGISCSGMGSYLAYLNPDGSRNHEKIFQELDDLGWMCYFMDDGSYGPIITGSKAMYERFAGRFRLGKVKSNGLEFTMVDADHKYLLPHFWYKIKTYDHNVFGSYWRKFFPELFEPVVSNDLYLSFVNGWTASKTRILDDSVRYYRSRGFPWPSYNDEYTLSSWNGLVSLNTSGMWRRDGETIRYNNYGDGIFKRFMKHLPEASYRSNSPMRVFNSDEGLRKTLAYCLNTSRSILPVKVHDALYYFNGGVSAFPCAVAKTIAERFCAPGGVVVDPCAGWGGRMLGVASSGRVYVGFEPWNKTSEALNSIVSFLGLERCTIHGSNFDPSKAPTKCDLVFTSPPYADLEVYGRAFSRKDWEALMVAIFHYAADSLPPSGMLALCLPERLLDGISIDRSLKREDSVCWQTRPRSKGSLESILVWSKS